MYVRVCAFLQLGTAHSTTISSPLSPPQEGKQENHTLALINLFPTVKCVSPKLALELMRSSPGNQGSHAVERFLIYY